jgi:flavin reductase (DIM6/NTAB) family NADH-FMN oxidoreductase RutF
MSSAIPLHPPPSGPSAPVIGELYVLFICSLLQTLQHGDHTKELRRVGYITHVIETRNTEKNWSGTRMGDNTSGHKRRLNDGINTSLLETVCA